MKKNDRTFRKPGSPAKIHGFNDQIDNANGQDLLTSPEKGSKMVFRGLTGPASAQDNIFFITHGVMESGQPDFTCDKLMETTFLTHH